MTENKLPKFSYSKLSTYLSCPMKFKLKYVDGNYDSSEAIHLDLGNIAHKVLEIKHRNIIDGLGNDYTYLKSVFNDGIAEETEKDKGNFLIGFNSIKDKYGEDIISTENPKSKLSYYDKIDIFNKYLVEDELEDDWKPIAIELHFEFEYEGNIILHGFIDRVDQNSKGEIRVVDYKSSNMPFEHKDLTTPLQMFIYTLACEHIYGKTPIEHVYDMIFIGEKQYACTKGYYKRGKKKLDGLIHKIVESEKSGIYKPSPTPLCHWCEFSKTNPNASFYLQDKCEYYSLWLPNKKSFNVNKKYEEVSVEDLEF